MIHARIEILNVLQAYSIVVRYFRVTKNEIWRRSSLVFTPSNDYNEAWEFGCDCHAECESHHGDDPAPRPTTPEATSERGGHNS